MLSPTSAAARAQRFPRQRSFARLQLAAAWLLRVLALVLATEVSGSLHAAMDLAVVAGVFAHPDDDCELDGHECPPGCLSCHCTHALAWSRPFVTAVETALPPPTTSAKPVGYVALVHSRAEAGRLDRPPRVGAHIG